MTVCVNSNLLVKHTLYYIADDFVLFYHKKIKTLRVIIYVSIMILTFLTRKKRMLFIFRHCDIP